MDNIEGLRDECEALLKDKKAQHRALVWLDLKPMDAVNIDVEQIAEVCDEHQGDVFFVLTLKKHSTDFSAPTKFEAFDIGQADAQRLEASKLHDEIKLIIEEGDKQITPSKDWLQRFNKLLSDTFQKLSTKSAPLAAMYALDNPGELKVRMCVIDITFIHRLRNAILNGELVKALNRALQTLGGAAPSFIRRQASDLKDAFSLPSSSPPPPPPSPPPTSRIAVRVDLTHFAARYESLIYQLDTLTPHQRHVRSQLKDKSHVIAAAGTGKTFIALDVMLKDCFAPGEKPTGDGSEFPVLFVASAKALAITLIKWLYIRLIHVHDCTEEAAAELLSSRLHVLFTPLTDGPQECMFSDGRIHLKSTAAASEYGLIVVD